MWMTTHNTQYPHTNVQLSTSLTHMVKYWTDIELHCIYLPSLPTIISLVAHITTVYCRNQDGSTPTGVQGIIADSPFSCSGFLSRWEVCFASNLSSVDYNITVQLWKPLGNSCFKLEWSNAFQNLARTDSNSGFFIQQWSPCCVNISMPEPRDIPGLSDYTIGFLISIIGTSFSRRNGRSCTSQTDDVVNHILLEDIDASEYDKFCSISRQIMQRPSIRAIVGECIQHNVHLIIRHVWRHKDVSSCQIIVDAVLTIIHFLLTVCRVWRCVSSHWDKTNAIFNSKKHTLYRG